MQWGKTFAKAADKNARVSFDEAVELTRQVALETGDGDLSFGADMVLQHYRHPVRATIETLVVAAKKRQTDARGE